MSRSRSCQDAGESLKACIERTACFDSREYSMQECLVQDRESGRGECADVHHAYVRCKMELVDPRARLTGIASSGSSKSSFFSGSDS